MKTSHVTGKASLRRVLQTSTLLGLLAAASVPSAFAANWDGSESALWNTAANWTPSGIPSAAGTASFIDAGNGNTVIDLGAGASILYVEFSNASTAAYTIGSRAVGSQNLTLTNGAILNMYAPVVNDQTFNANLLIGANATASYATFNNSSPTNTLHVAGAISGNTGGTAAVKDLSFSGAGRILLSGNISNGGATSLKLTLGSSMSGTVVLSGTNTQTGAISVNSAPSETSGGTIQFAKRVSLFNADTAQWTAANLGGGNYATLAFNVGGTGEFTTTDVTTLLTNLGTGATGGLRATTRIGFDTTNAAGGTFEVADNIAHGTNGVTNIGVTKLGTNTLNLSSTNDYYGATRVSAGTLLVTGTLAHTSGVVVSAGAALELGSANRIVNTASLTLSGGAFNVGGFSETLGALTLTDATTSSLDFASGTSTLLFSSITAGTGVLDITNWTVGVDSLRFTSNVNLSASSFTVNGGSAAIINQGGYYEVVPEPATWALLGIGLTTTMVLRRRRSR